MTRATLSLSLAIAAACAAASSAAAQDGAGSALQEVSTTRLPAAGPDRSKGERPDAARLRGNAKPDQARSGVRVAVGDVDSDGAAEARVNTGRPDFRRPDGATAGGAAPQQARSGGVYVAAGDLDGDGAAEAAVNPSRPDFRRPDGATAPSGAGPQRARSGGVRVATGDVNGDGVADLPTSQPNGQRTVQIKGDEAPVVCRAKGGIVDASTGQPGCRAP